MVLQVFYFNGENMEDNLFGIYVLISNAEKDVLDFLTRDGLTILNLHFKEAIKVPVYFKQKKLKISNSSIDSHSDAPNQTQSVLLDLLKNSEQIIVGTAGLSADSINGIIEKVWDVIKPAQLVVFVHIALVNRSEMIKIDNLSQLPNFS